MDDPNRTKQSPSGRPVLIVEITVGRRFWSGNRPAILEALRRILTGMARESTGQPDCRSLGKCARR